MCGIAGSVNFRLPYESIKSAMGHRGPNEEGTFSHANVDLFHLRLAILDISSGKQPMTLDDRYTIIFNGEIYNFNNLKVELEASGVNFRGHSDSEVLLHLFARDGALWHLRDRL